MSACPPLSKLSFSSLAALALGNDITGAGKIKNMTVISCGALRFLMPLEGFSFLALCQNAASS